MLDRRKVLLLLAAGALGAINAGEHVSLDEASGPGSGSDKARLRLPSLPEPHPGRAVLVDSVPNTARGIALTIDDGYDQETVAAYVQFCQDSGTHLTFCPNGTYSTVWDKHAKVLRPLIAAGQVQIANHTFSHPDLTRLETARVRREIQNNEQWVNRTFGITTRPWFRPPYGSHNARTDDIAGSLGFTRILTWNGDLGDAFLISPQTLLSNARRDLQAGRVLLGHANHPTVTHLYDELVGIIRQRNLAPGTLDELFGTTRSRG